jgi:hypothetical protein
VARPFLVGTVVLFCSLLAGGVLVAAALVNLAVSQPLRISTETTYITEPLTPDGKHVDYFGAIQQRIQPDNAATDDNGYRLLVQHLGKSPDSSAEHFETLCKKLGLAAGTIQPDMVFEDPYDFLEAYIDSEDGDAAFGDQLQEQSAWDRREAFHERLRRPWTLDDLPMMHAWLQANDPALDMIGRAVQKPVFYIPLVRRSEDELLLSILLPEIQWKRSLARGLSARANYRIGTGDLDGAIEDFIACKRLGRHIGHGATVIHMLVGIATEGIADAIGIAGSFEHQPTVEQLRRLVEQAENLPPPADLDQKLLVERFTALDIVQSLASGKRDATSELGLDRSPARHFTALAYDWNIVAKRFNQHFDAMAATGDEPPVESFNPLIFISRRARSEHMADMLAHLLLPAWDAVREATRRIACTHQMKRITLAMLIYERDHGTLPPAYSVDADGAPLHSWRVLLLPYLGHEALYNKIRLDEPWDSQHNRQFHDQAAAFYRCPSDPAALAGQATYSVVIGPDMPFQAGEGKRLAAFGPDSDDRILLVERAEPVCWMTPTAIPQSRAEEGIQQHGSQYLPAPTAEDIASHHPGGAMFGHRSGAVAFLSNTTDVEQFNAMLRGTHQDEADFPLLVPGNN